MKKILPPQAWYMIGFVLVLTLAFGLLYLFSSRSIQTRQEAILELEADVIAHDVEHFFNDTAVTLDNVARFIETQGEDDLLEYLIILDEADESIASLYLGKPDNTMVNSTGFQPSGDFDLRERAWYQDAIAEDRTVYSDAFLNATEDRLIVTIARPVYDDGDLIGVLGADIDIAAISSRVQEATVGEAGFAFVFDASGHVIGHPEYSEADLTLRDIRDYHPDYEEPKTLGLSDNDTIGEKDGVLHQSRLMEDAYTLTLYMPASDHANQAQILGINFLALFIMVFAFGGLGTLLYYKYYTKPSRLLFKEIEALDFKDPEQSLKTAPSMGLQEVRDSLNGLLKRQHEYFDKYTESEHELMLENQRVKRLVESNADILFEVDTNRRYRAVFGKGLETLGLSSEKVIGKTAPQLHGKIGYEQDRAYKKALNGQKMKYEWSVSTSTGKRYYETAVSPIYDADGSIYGAVGIARDITNQKEKQQEIIYLSERDMLTGLYNRRHYTDFLQTHNQPAHHPLGVLMIDLNGLKIFNDAYGHETGDQALRSVADTLRPLEDDTHHIARIGGDEFAVVVLNTSETALQRLKDHIHFSVSTVKIHAITLSVAVGYAHKDEPSESLDDLIRAAEDFMYRNKLIEGRSARNNTIRTIQETLGEKFKVEKHHSEWVAAYARRIAEALDLPDYQKNELELAARYHDIGKISLPDTLLEKPGPLSEKEYETLKKHTEYGYQILRAADEYSDLAKHALYHHERYDGTGYPEGLKGEAIPLFSRIIAVADAYEAMTSNRPYREAKDEKAALEELRDHSGTQFDPRIVDAFLGLME